MLRARSTWASMRGCPELEIQVAQVPEGISVMGCGGYGVCPGSAMNCFAATPPTCRDQVRARYELCTNSASRMGARGRDPVYYPAGVAAAATDIARNVTSTVAESNRAQACQESYQLELQRCP